MAHAEVAAMYKKDYGNRWIGISTCGDFRYPLDGDAASSERALLFHWGWFVDPLVFGDYPPAMRERLGNRLPTFGTEESAAWRRSFDFLGLYNYYSAFYAATPTSDSTFPGYWADMHVNFRFVTLTLLVA